MYVYYHKRVESTNTQKISLGRRKNNVGTEMKDKDIDLNANELFFICEKTKAKVVKSQAVSNRARECLAQWLTRDCRRVRKTERCPIVAAAQ